ncbi:MAG: cyclic nucleotide-binding domain-containing protein [Chloroflexi bacterium]|nr:cyclic nucleotide-binding domain-containing protein [Chloroflexota bacterium]
MSNIDFLRQLELFKGLPPDDLARLCAMSSELVLVPEEYLMHEGDPGGALYVILDGEFQVTKRLDGQEVVLAVRGRGEVIGEMALLDRAPRGASVRALKPTRALMVDHDSMQKLLTTSASAALAILHTMTQRIRSNEALLRQSEKMAGLGTLAAGVAHELNNPAAAAKRSADQMRSALTTWLAEANQVGALNLNATQSQVVNDLRDAIAHRAAPDWTMSPLERSDRESALQEWLEACGVEDAWDLTANLVTVGWTPDNLKPICDNFDAAQLPAIIRWLNAGTSVYLLLDEVSKSAERISEIVKAVKTYSYLDQAPVQEVNVQEGLENTLVILRHKIKQGVTIKKEYAVDLPRIEALGSELNQVWTNIMDNALDALKPQLEQGKPAELVVRTFTQDEHVVVEIQDNGPGIPEEIRDRIYEPFFTTKSPGIGTGLGLHITYNIVVHKHHGQIKLFSEPGCTRFQVWLPVRFDRAQLAKPQG